MEPPPDCCDAAVVVSGRTKVTGMTRSADPQRPRERRRLSIGGYSGTMAPPRRPCLDGGAIIFEQDRPLFAQSMHRPLAFSWYAQPEAISRGRDDDGPINAENAGFAGELLTPRRRHVRRGALDLQRDGGSPPSDHCALRDDERCSRGSERGARIETAAIGAGRRTCRHGRWAHRRRHLHRPQQSRRRHRRRSGARRTGGRRLSLGSA